MNITIKLSKTYKDYGFFNIPVKFKHLFTISLKTIKIRIKNETFECKIDFNVNNTGSPRILGGKQLANFFQKNFNLYENIDIDFFELENIQSSTEETEIKEFYKFHHHTIKKLEGFYCYLNVPNINERIIKIHFHSCGFCNYGTGRNMEGNEPGRNGAWLGPFSRIEQVNELLNQFIPESLGIKLENCNCVNKNKQI